MPSETIAQEQMEVADEAARLSDEQLLLAYREQGDRASLETLIRRYQRELYGFLRRYLHDDVLAEDAFQLTFLQVHKKAALFDSTRRFRPWLYSVATNQAIDLKRAEKRRRMRTLECSANASELQPPTHMNLAAVHYEPSLERLVRQEQQAQVRSALEELGEPGRSALELVYLQGMQYRDAAVILDVPVGTVKSRVHTAIRKLADIWKRTVKYTD